MNPKCLVGQVRSIAWALALAGVACSGAGSGDEAFVEDEVRASAGPRWVTGVDIHHWSGEINDSQLECLWREKNVRHVVSGTQNRRITRAQLHRAVKAGMTVDAYVYLYWNRSVGDQVREALETIAPHPVRMLWLDIEEPASGLGRADLEARISEGLEACGGFRCGIYTSTGWWETWMGGSTAFSDAELWWAYYDGRANMDNWAARSFGDWAAPVAKQYTNTMGPCGVNADFDIFSVDVEPERIVDRRPQPPPVSVPSAPTGLYPETGAVIPVWAGVRAQCDLISNATGYEFEIEQYVGRSNQWRPYYTYRSASSGVRFSPSIRDAYYRFRARAKNGLGSGPWSSWAQFGYGQPASPPPAVEGSSSTPPATGSSPPSNGTPQPTGGTPPPPSGQPASSPPGAPANLSPNGAILRHGDGVRMSCDPVMDAERYEFEIESASGGASFVPYFKYSSMAPAKTFWPAYIEHYRFRVRAQGPAGWTPWSGWATFDLTR